MLRGPQGTLYGINATAGSLNIITRTPKQEFDFSAEISYGNYGTVDLRGMLNLPVTNTLAARVAYISYTNDGYQDTNNSTTRNYSITDDTGVRLTALWQPLDNFTWRLSAEDYRGGGTPAYNVATGADGKPANGLSAFDFTATSSVNPQNNVDKSSIRSRMDWNINEAWTVSFTAGYSEDDYSVITEWTGLTPAAGAPVAFQHSYADTGRR